QQEARRHLPDDLKVLSFPLLLEQMDCKAAQCHGSREGCPLLLPLLWLSSPAPLASCLQSTAAQPASCLLGVVDGPTSTSSAWRTHRLKAGASSQVIGGPANASSPVLTTEG
ncbi:hypothetical protein XENOCAPTIV_001738, partial [Xenoophorus captivus]